MPNFSLRGIDESVSPMLKANASSIGISVIVLGELLAGFVVGGREAKNRHELNDFLSSPRVSLLEIDSVVIEHLAT